MKDSSCALRFQLGSRAFLEPLPRASSSSLFLEPLPRPSTPHLSPSTLPKPLALRRVPHAGTPMLGFHPSPSPGPPSPPWPGSPSPPPSFAFSFFFARVPPPLIPRLGDAVRDDAREAPRARRVVVERLLERPHVAARSLEQRRGGDVEIDLGAGELGGGLGPPLVVPDAHDAPRAPAPSPALNRLTVSLRWSAVTPSIAATA